MRNSIYILTGEIQTGKTTALANWCEPRSDVAGILTPIINGKRQFENILTKEVFDMEATDKEKDVLCIGKYRFSKKAFDKAKRIIEQPLPSTIHYLIIDEIGPLEIRREGFYNSVKTVLEKNCSQKIILVVRKNVVNDVITAFDLAKNHTIIIEKSFFDTYIY